MADRRAETDDATLLRDLDTWFGGEVRQAASDLRRFPLRSTAGRIQRCRRGSVPGAATGAVLVVVLVVAGISRLPSADLPAAEPAGSAPSALTISPMPASPTATNVISERYRDGIPRAIGDEVVTRPNALDRDAPEDGRSFLVGGWLLRTGMLTTCLGPPSPLVTSSCQNPVIADTPLFGSSGLPIVLDQLVVDEGPVVLRVHRDDPRAADCAPDIAAACREAAVVEAIVWSSDEVTRTAPISTVHVMRRLESIIPGLELMVVGDTIAPSDPAFGSSCDPGFPAQTWTTPGREISMILVFPSVAARDAVDGNFTASGWRGTTPDGTLACMITTDSSVNNRWISAHNVMVAVRVDVAESTLLQRTLVAKVEEAFLEP